MGEDAYCYRGEACLTKESVEDFGSKPVSSFSCFFLSLACDSITVCLQCGIADALKRLRPLIG